jgi:hypothetical protein
MLVSNVLNAVTRKDPQSPTSSGDGSTTAQQGTPTILPVNTNNKLPAVFGRAFISPIIVDAKLSTDNQTMWYVLALSESPASGDATVSLTNMYWNEQLMTFSASDWGRVTKFTNNSGQEDTKVDGNLWVYPFNSSSVALPIGGVSSTTTAFTILQDSAIPPSARWSGSESMTETVFVIVKLVYSTDDDITGLQNLIVDISVDQTGITGYKPGSAMLEYLLNDRWGAGLTTQQVDVASFNDLDTYSDEVITYTPVGGGGATQPRYRLNGVVDTTQTIMTNMLAMAECCDSYIQYNELYGKWGIVINKSYLQEPNQQVTGDLFALDDSNIIGGVNITPLDLNSTPNSVESQFNNYKTRGQADYAYATTPERLQNKFEPPQQLSMRYQFVNDYVRAQYLSNRKLEQCRADFIVDLTCDYSAIQVNAGDIVLLTYEPHGGGGLSWTNKPFRVVQVQEQREDSGTLICKLQMSEYSEQVYDNQTIEDFTPPMNNFVLDPTILPQPAAPTIIDILPAAGVPEFKVAAVTPATGVVVAIEFWYGPTATITNNNYKLWGTQYNSSGAQYSFNQSESITVTGLPAGDWYWSVRMIGTRRKSDFSPSTLLVWNPVTAESNVGDTDGAGDKSDMVLVPYVNGTTNWPNNTRGIMPAAGVTIITTGNPGSIRVNFSTSIWANTFSEMNCVELWKSTASEVFSKQVYSIRHSYDSTTAQTAVNRIQAIGLNMDYISDDGGVTWSLYDATSTTRSLTGSLPFWIDGTWNYQTHVVGSYQDADGVSPDYVNSGFRDDDGGTETPPVNIEFITTPTGVGTSKIIASFNDVAKIPYTGGTSSLNQSSIIVGDNGYLFFWRNISPFAQPIAFGSGQTWVKETTNTLQNLYSVYAGRTDGSGNYTVCASGSFGTIIKSTRVGVSTQSSWSSKSVEDSTGAEVIKNLYAVASDDTVSSSTSVWVAVGQNGTVVSSIDNGETWILRPIFLADGVTPVTSTLRAVRWGGGKWLICGDGGTILTSTDSITWTIVSAPSGVTTRNFYSIDYSSVWDKFNIGGEGIILNTASSTIAPTSALQFTPDESYTLERLWHRGSHANVQTVGTAVSSQNRLVNGQTVSSTIIDTKYNIGDELGYYLVVGSVRGVASQEVRVSGSVVTATEYKK